MKIDKIKKLEKEVKKKDFATEYGSVNKLLRVLSVFGNLGSIFAASFFMMKLMGGLISNVILVAIVTFIILISLELVKRIIFNKFSLEFIRSGFNVAKKEVVILMLFSVGIICASFYSSLNGAQEFANRNDEIENVISEDMDIYEDSIRNKIYNPKIDAINEEIVYMKEDTRTKDTEITTINEKLKDRGWLGASERRRVKDLKSEKAYNREQITIKRDKIASLEKDLGEDIELYESDIKEQGDGDKEENKSNGLIFVAISTIIEFTILIGIFFGKFYSYTSYKNFKKKMDKDPKYQKWILYNGMIDVVYMNDAIVGDKLPTQKDIMKFCKMNEIYLSRNELSEFFKLMGALKIIKTSGPHKFIHKEREETDEILGKYFKIQ